MYLISPELFTDDVAYNEKELKYLISYKKYATKPIYFI